jgi:hypothetical protein
MKTVSPSLKALVPAALATIATLAPTGDAVAASNYVLTHAAACRNYFGVPANDIVHYVDSVRNTATVPRYVVCPAPRSPKPIENGHLIEVDVTIYGIGRIDCTMYSIDFWTGYVIAAKSVPVINNYNSTRSTYATAYFTNAEMPSGAHTSVLCYLPPNQKGSVRGIWAVDY